MKQDLTLSEALVAVRAAVRWQYGEANAAPLMEEVNEYLRIFGELPPLTEAEEAARWARLATRAAAVLEEHHRRAGEVSAEEAEEVYERVVARAEAREEEERDGFDWDGQ